MLTTKLKKLEPRKQIHFTAERVKFTPQTGQVDAVLKHPNGKLYDILPTKNFDGFIMVKRTEST